MSHPPYSFSSFSKLFLQVRLMLTLSAIAQHFGPEDWGEFGIEHFFRPLKKDAAAVRDVVKRGEPAKGFYDSKAVS